MKGKEERSAPQGNNVLLSSLEASMAMVVARKVPSETPIRTTVRTEGSLENSHCNRVRKEGSLENSHCNHVLTVDSFAKSTECDRNAETTHCVEAKAADCGSELL